MYKKLLACGLALLMCGCSTKAAGNDQVLTVGLSSEMNGTFSPMYYQTTNDSYSFHRFFECCQSNSIFIFQQFLFHIYRRR